MAGAGVVATAFQAALKAPGTREERRGPGRVPAGPL
ncbi:hypothetical protein WA016_03565 [Myxococcus stipitatus]